MQREDERKMNSFAVVTDSAADIPSDLAERFGIRVVPLHVVFQGRDYADGVDLDTPQLLDLMRGSDTLPVTSQPTPADFMAVYQGLIEEGYTQILSIHLARALSATIESARTLAGQVPEGVRLEVVDSCSATVGEGLMALEAAAIAQAGGTMDDALARIESLRGQMHIHFIPATLENLVKGGRATRAQGFAASLLDIKLVIGLKDDGSIEVERKAKGMRGAIRFMAQRVADQAGEAGGLMYYKLQVKARDTLGLVDGALSKTRADLRFLTEATIGPVIATHVGEGAVGIFCYPASLHLSALDDLGEYLTPTF